MMQSHALARVTVNRITRERFRAHVRHRPRRPMSVWAEDTVVLPNSTTRRAGPLRLDVAPYLREVMDAVSSRQTRHVTLIAPSQSAKTTFVIVVALFFAKQEPSPGLIVEPTLDMANDLSKGRLTPTIDASPELKGLIAPARSRDSNNTILSKAYPGGQMDITGANSPAGLASRPKRWVLFDEVDRYPEEAGSEGDPISIGSARTISYEGSEIIIVVTSPTDEPTQDAEGRWFGSRGWREYLKGTREVYESQCPECQHWQVIDFDRLTWEVNAEGNIDPESVHYPCADCQFALKDRDRARMAKRWRATNPGAGPEHRSFHLEGMSAAFSRWTSLAAGFYSKRTDPVELKTFVNTMLGRLWKDRRLDTQKEALAARAKRYDGGKDDEEIRFDVPQEVGVLTCGVDVQHDRLEASVWGWGVGQQSWLIDHEILHGDPTQNAVWQRLTDWRQRTWTHELGAEMRLHAVAIDAGDGNMSGHVYRYCATRLGENVFAIKGHGKPDAPLTPRLPSKAKPGRVYLLGVNGLTERWYRRLSSTTVGPGYVHLNHFATEAFVKQLLGMERKYDPKARRRRWMARAPHVEAADCANYALGALLLSTRDEELAAEVEGMAKKGEEAKNPKPPTPEPAAAPAPSSWMGRRSGSWMGRVR